MDELLQELKNQLRQAQQNFNYADDDYIDAAIFEMNAVNEKFRAMLREKRREKNVRSKGKRKFTLLGRERKKLQSPEKVHKERLPNM